MSEWDDYAGGWDDDPGARAYAAAAFGSLQKFLAASGQSFEGMNVLDFGCGTGLLTEQLVTHGAAVLAVDTSSAMLEVLSAKIADHGWTSVMVANELPTTSLSYDLIVCSSVCGFLDDYPGTAAALADLLVRDGWFVQWDWERDDTAVDAGDDPHGLTRTEIATALRAAGLVDVAVHVGFEAAFEAQTMAPLMGTGRRPAS